MNTKFFFVLLVVALVLAACVPAITGVSAPLAEPQIPVIVPVTGENVTVVRTVPEPRLFSGEVFLSDNDSPDHEWNPGTSEQSACMSEESQPRRVGGCIE